RRTVPAGVELRCAVVPIGLEGRPDRGLSLPGEAVHAVVLALVGKPGVQADGTVGVVLGVPAGDAPGDQPVSVREELVGPGGEREEALVVSDLALQGRLHPPAVQREHDRPGLRPALPGTRAVVEQAQGPAALVQASIVLEAELRPLAHREVALLAAEPPEHLATTA